MSDTAPQLISSGNLPTPNWHATHDEAQKRLTRMADGLAAAD
jgi:hypothetical protein